MRSDVRMLDVKFMDGLNWCANGRVRHGKRLSAAYAQLFLTLAQLLKPNQTGLSYVDERQDMTVRGGITGSRRLLQS